MDLPPIHYVRTPDGFRIAYSITGSGPSLLMMPTIWGPIEQWRVDTVRALLESLGRHFTVIRYDGRGQGRSSRGISGHTVDDQLVDLEAVASAAGLTSFYLWALFWYAPGAIRYAADHPERVRGLMLWNPRPGGASERDRAMMELATRDWEMYLQVSEGLAVSSPSEPATRGHMERDMRSVSQADYLVMAQANIDRAPIAPDCRRVTVPVLVLATDARPTEEIAAFVDTIEGSRYIHVSSMFAAPLQERSEPLVSAFVDFANCIERQKGRAERESAPTPSSALTQRQLEVLRLIAAGRTTEEIGVALVISERTAARHVANVYVKIGAHNRAEATAYAMRNGIST